MRTKRQPDYSDLIVHFTKSAPPYGSARHPDRVQAITHLAARERLFRILEEGKLEATPMPWTDVPAVCFTECTWPSLLTHGERYSPYGVGLSKSLVFKQGGGPAIYLRQDLFQLQFLDNNIYAFVTPFAPDYASANLLVKGQDVCDYTYEREWRAPRDLAFTLPDVAFVTVDTYEDMAVAPKRLKDAIGRENWIIFSNCRKIEQLWPQHVL